MARPRTIDPQEVVASLRDGTFKYGSEAARHFGCSRVRIRQIVEEHAPDLLVGKVKPRSRDEQKTIDSRQAMLREETVRALKTSEKNYIAAERLGLTTSGLYSRMRRLGIPSPYTKPIPK